MVMTVELATLAIIGLCELNLYEFLIRRIRTDVDFYSVNDFSLCNNDVWERQLKVQFRHEDTKQYLAVSGRSFGRPISGQMEVCAVNSGSASGTEWLAAEGIFLHPNEPSSDNLIHTEL